MVRLASLFAALALISTPAFAEEGRPNILLILADDLGYSDLGCMGGEIQTPNLDALAANGLRFAQFYNGARCCPSRAALLTGLYPHQAGVGEMINDAGAGFPGYRGRLSDRCVTIPKVLGSCGYRTSMVGKWHLGANPGPIRSGFEEFYGMMGGFNTFWEEKPHYTRLPGGRAIRPYPPGTFYATDVFGDYAIDFLAQARTTKEKPWFLYLAFNAPHFPLQAPRADVDRYEAQYAEGWDEVRRARMERMKGLGLWPEGSEPTPRGPVPRNRFSVQTGWADRENPAWTSLPSDRRADLARRMAVYAAMVDRMDQAIGRVVADLRRVGELDKTLILFLSDNGACAEWDPWGFDGSSGPDNVIHRGDDLAKVGGPDSYLSYGSGWANASNTPFRLYKHQAYEGGIRTPLIAHWPAGIKARGAIRQQAGHLIDVMATCVDVARASYPTESNGLPTPPMEGRSLVPAFDDRPLERDLLAWEHEGNRAIRVGRWKLVGLAGKPWELYDIDADGVESHDLAEGRTEVVADLARKWEAWAARVSASPSPGLGH